MLYLIYGLFIGFVLAEQVARINNRLVALAFTGTVLGVVALAAFLPFSTVAALAVSGILAAALVVSARQEHKPVCRIGVAIAAPVGWQVAG